ncbi:MAG: universal stress protein [Thermodesulfobacteriota bacterium]
MFTNILCALKFSPASLQALATSVELCRGTGAHLTIFHALDYRLLGKSPSDPDWVNSAKHAKEAFLAQVEPMLKGFTEFTFSCWPADPSLEVCRLAWKTESDLIVIGCHQGKEGRSMGRVDLAAMTIFENAPCKVMLVPFREQSGPASGETSK